MNTHEFDHVFWLSGSPCAGKSSLARMLARTHGLLLYSTDDHIMGGHLFRADAASFPALDRARSLSDRYFDQPPDLILETTFGYLREAWPLVLDDVRRLPRDRNILVEGVCLFPDLVLEVTDSSRIVCVVPTPDFYALRQPGRASTVTLLSQSPDPSSAFERMSKEHEELSRYFLECSLRFGIRVLRTASEESLIENLRTIEEWFALAPRS